jgi:hypothetical protein
VGTLAVELTQKHRASLMVDWSVRETVRARWRVGASAGLAVRAEAGRRLQHQAVQRGLLVAQRSQ